MIPRIHPSFWSDDRIGALDPDLKLALVWCITNKDTSNVGFLIPSKRQFEFDTGLKWKTLEDLANALPTVLFSDVSEGQLKLWIRSYIRYQWLGGSAWNNRNICNSLCVLIEGLPEFFRKTLLRVYPVFARALKDMRDTEGAARPSKGQSPPLKSDPIKSSSEWPSLEEYKTAAEMSAIPEHVAMEDWHYQEKLDPPWRGIGNWRKHLNHVAVKWQANGRPGPGQSRPPNPVAERIGLEKAAKNLREKIAGHSANKGSASFKPSCTDAERGELRLLREKLRETEALISST